MPDRRDMWKECYAGDHAKNMSPEAFKFQFCSRCGNSGCGNSASGQTRWQRRIETQEEILLNNPSFADPDDPRFKDVRELDFPDLLRKAMKIEIASQRNDWEPVTELDAMAYAAELSRPAGFEPEPEIEPVIVRQEILPGSAGRSYTVTIGEHAGQPVYDCTCQAFEFNRIDANGMCKHIRQLLGAPEPKPGEKVQRPQLDKEKAPREAVLPPPKTRPSPGGRNSRPTPEQWNQVSERNLVPKANNTRFPSDGLMLDGTAAPPPPEPVDPWAPKQPVEGTVVEVGGSFVLGGDSPKGDD